MVRMIDKVRDHSQIETPIQSIGDHGAGSPAETGSLSFQGRTATYRRDDHLGNRFKDRLSTSPAIADGLQVQISQSLCDAPATPSIEREATAGVDAVRLRTSRKGPLAVAQGTGQTKMADRAMADYVRTGSIEALNQHCGQHNHDVLFIVDEETGRMKPIAFDEQQGAQGLSPGEKAQHMQARASWDKGARLRGLAE